MKVHSDYKRNKRKSQQTKLLSSHLGRLPPRDRFALARNNPQASRIEIYPVKQASGGFVYAD